MQRRKGESETISVQRNEMHTSAKGLRTAVPKSKPYSRTRDKTNKGKDRSKKQGHGVQIAQRNFLSHSEFPDVQTAVAMTSDDQVEILKARADSTRKYSSNKPAKFKPFDPNHAPANFLRNNINKQSNQVLNSTVNNSSPYYPEQGQTLYHFIPPTEFENSRNTRDLCPFGRARFDPSVPSATAVAPSGRKIFIPLDNSKYEIKTDNHDLYEIPEDCELRPLSSEGEFESCVHFERSPRPIDERGSLSDEWGSSDEYDRYTGSDSDCNEETSETDDSEIASRYVAKALDNLTEGVGSLSVEEDNNPTKIGEDDGFKKRLKEMILVDLQVHQKQKEDSEDYNSTRIETEPDKHVDKIVKTKIEHEVDAENKTCEIKDKDGLALEGKSSSTVEHNNLNTAQNNIETSQNEETQEQTTDPSIDDKADKKLKKTKPRTWKQTRKEKETEDNEKSNDNKTTELNDNKNDHSPKGGLTQQANETRATNYDTTSAPQCFQPDTSSMYYTPGANQDVIIDGQVYFQTNQTQGTECAEYQPYYFSENYVFQTSPCQQQCDSTVAPAYTMFIHDACPPPRQDEGFTQIHKSLSGELINLTASTQTQEQMHDGTCFPQPDLSPQQIGVDYSNEQFVNFNPCYTGPSAKSTENQSSSDQGQLFVCYDDESVYVDPESGLSYPAIHMTDDNLITVILRNGVFLEITLNKGLRLVNHEKKIVVAMNENGNRTCVIHPAARIYQSDFNVHAELYLDRRAKITEKFVMFGNKSKTYKFDERRVTEMTEEPVFRDLSHDDSVDFLATECGLGSEETKIKMNEILGHAHFWKNGERGSTVIINGTKIVQNEKGEVSVYSGPIRFLRMNPEKSILRLKTHNVEVDIESNWNVKVTRGSNAINASHIGFIVSNGKIKACLDSNNVFHSFSMPDHKVIMLGQPVPQHRPGVPGGQRRRPPSHKGEPEGDHWGYVQHSPESQQYCFSSDWNTPIPMGFSHEHGHDNRRRWDPMAGKWVYPSRQWRSREHR